MIPIKADLPTRTFPFVTIGLISINILIFLYEISLGPRSEQFIFTYGAIPFELVRVLEISRPAPIIKSMFTSMFLHGGLWHVGANMLYLWIFGNNIEDEMGHLRFILFYLLCGVIAAYCQAVINPTSQIPMIGASGAVSGVLGAYLIRFPRAKILTLFPIGFFVHFIRIPAIIFLGLWIFPQLINGIFSLQQTGGIAWFAHVGGFLAGMLLIHQFVKKGKGEKRHRHHQKG
ncbi:MAG: rhomboid family intramembrane serine protease [Nitrospiria bacterium]